MSILMDALKQQLEPAAAVAGLQQRNGWRNLALLLGFCLALLLGFALASWWQSANGLQATADLAVNQPAEPELADSASIVAALVNAEPENSATLPAQPAAVEQQKPKQELFKPEPKIVTVTAPTPEQAQTEVQSVTQQPEPAVSDELRQRFASAMAASEINPRRPNPEPRGSNAPAKDISTLAPGLLQQIPSLRFEAHVYATQSRQRWIKVNGKSLQEGQWVTADVRLKEITPHYVLLEMGAELFSMPALTDYK